MKLQPIIAWFSQQSTQKAIIAGLAAFGVQVNVVNVEQAFSLFMGMYALLAGFRDKS